jgi:hypothetical protein
MFDRQCCIISQNYIAPIDGILSVGDFDVLFESLHGEKLKFNEMVYTDGKIKIEWAEWSIKDLITSHFIFRIMPMDGIPEGLFSHKYLAYQTKLSQINIEPHRLRRVNHSPSTERTRLLDKFSKRIENEIGIDYEFRVVNFLNQTFAAIKKA